MMCQVWMCQVWSLSARGWLPNIAQSFRTASCSNWGRLLFGIARPFCGTTMRSGLRFCGVVPAGGVLEFIYQPFDEVLLLWRETTDVE